MWQVRSSLKEECEGGARGGKCSRTSYSMANYCRHPVLCSLTLLRLCKLGVVITICVYTIPCRLLSLIETYPYCKVGGLNYQLILMYAFIHRRQEFLSVYMTDRISIFMSISVTPYWPLYLNLPISSILIYISVSVYIVSASIYIIHIYLCICIYLYMSISLTHLYLYIW